MPERPAKRVLLIGWDAADWKVINPLMDAGLMPALQGLVNGGVIGNIATLDPPLSPILWTSIATGKLADKHGVLNFTQPDPEKKALRPVMGSTRRVKAIWNILNQEGLRSHVVGWWPSHPAEPLNGVTVSNFFQRAVAPYGEPWPLPPGTVHPPRLAETLAELRVHPGELTAAHIAPFVPTMAEIDQNTDRRLSTIGKIVADCGSVHAAATWIMENEPWDFMAVYYDAIDHFGHAFMKFHPPRRPFISEELYRHYHGVVQAGYRFHDMMLHSLLQLAGPETAVILVSDHGFHADHLRPSTMAKEPAGPAREHREYGILCLHGEPFLRDERVYGATLLDVAPTVLSLFGLPIGRDMDGAPLVNAFAEPLQPQYIASWEEAPGADGMHGPHVRQDPWAEQAMMEQMIALGYVDAPEEDQRLALEKNGRESQFYLARVYASTGRQEMALPLFEKLYQQAPQELRYGLRLAQCYRDLERLEDCRRVVEAIVPPDAESRPALDLLQATLLLAEEKPQEALLYLQRVEQSGSRTPDIFLRMGRAYAQMGAWERAEAAYRRALGLDPENALAYHGLSRVYLRRERYEEAAEAALTSVGLLYHQPLTHFYLGRALVGLGYFERAEEAFLVAIHQAPGLRRAYERLADLYETHMQQPAMAESIRQAAVERIRPASNGAEP
jgi:predicted AlkP superfamily phosphohydrolase/phosphomutase/tetratricopeptide (TPR) repeat protein